MGEEPARAPLDDLVPLAYAELKRLARSQLRRERPDHTLQTTALVHEAYLRLAGQHSAAVDRGQLLALAARMMRRILVNHAVARKTAKRGGGRPPLSLTTAAALGGGASAGPSVEIEALHEALTELEQLDPRQARVVELRYFGGLDVDETAEALGISSATVKREWQAAKLWLLRRVREGS